MRKGFTIKVWKSKELPADWFKRQKADEKAAQEVECSVKAIINQVKADGDAALVEFALKFDKAELNFRAPQSKDQEKSKKPTTKPAPEQISALKFMKEKVNTYQKQLLTQTEIKTAGDGISVQTVLRPIESVGCYVPGGQAAYPSTLVMTAVPAKVAGVPTNSCMFTIRC